MRFGLFYQLQLPRPWDEESEYQMLQDALEQIELADELGFDFVWQVEHHFLEEYSHSSAPEVFLAAVSQRTTTIRIGHGIIQTAPQYNHPARTAERVATLDLLSNGRVEFGSGESGTLVELGGFNISMEEKRAAWREGLEVVLRCMTEEPFSGHDGQFLSMPPRNVVPKPRQRPHPPLWLACSKRETIAMAAEMGMGALSFSFMDPEAARQWVDDYETAVLERLDPVGFTVNPQIACCLPMLCHPDEATAIERGLEGANFFGYSLGHYHAFGDHRPGVTPVWEEFEAKRGERGFDPAAAVALQQQKLGAKLMAGKTPAGLRGAVGTPEQLRQFMRRFEDAGVDLMLFGAAMGRTSHKHVCESLEVFGTEVLPEFRERDEEFRSVKAARLAPAIDAALERRAARPVPKVPTDYSVEPVFRDKLKELLGDDSIEKISAASATGEAGGMVDFLQIEDRLNRRR